MQNRTIYVTLVLALHNSNIRLLVQLLVLVGVDTYVVLLLRAQYVLAHHQLDHSFIFLFYLVKSFSVIYASFFMPQHISTICFPV
jgi:hypothetical protein